MNSHQIPEFTQYVRYLQENPAEVDALFKELQCTKHRLQTTIEEMESSLEELQSTNEEEMQSLNEELMTLNMQCLTKTEELSQAANDMKNLFDATEIATIFLNNDMVIKRFMPPVHRIVCVLPSNVGRPIMHFANTLRHPEHPFLNFSYTSDFPAAGRARAACCGAWNW